MAIPKVISTRGLLQAVAFAGATAMLVAPAAAEPAVRAATATPEAAAPSESILPNALSAADAERYREIFDLQEDGHWAKADKIVAKIQDPILLGHALAQRYLHATKYRASYNDLKTWMAKYADHPEATRIYKLALSRKPARQPAPAQPIVERMPPPEPQAGSGRSVTHAQYRTATQLKARIRSALKRGVVNEAFKLAEGPDARRLIGTIEYDEIRLQVAQGYFNIGDDKTAIALAKPAALRSGAKLPEAHWLLGLAHWRQGNLAEAARHFENAAVAAGKKSPWVAAAGAFWAARAHLLDRRPERVNRWLDAAAEHPRTFYGLLAGHILDRPMPFRWSEPAMEREVLQKLATVPAGKRALALVQIGEERRAETELRRLVPGADGDLAKGVLALAVHAGMPALAMRLDRHLFPKGDGWDSAAYPVPSWEPEDGFRVDPALIYALIRQESAFNPQAKSWAGASGLMQLMPRTASFVARDRAYHRGAKRRHLFEPELNLTLGQRYLEMLIKDANIQGDLFFIVAAWNGGPGNLDKWWRRTNHMNDPLFFIESIPSRETRIFVERVLANLWIYRHRFDESSTSLAAIAAGEWPTYTPAGDAATMMAEHDKPKAR